MVSGAHVLLYGSDPEADRAFFRDVLGFRFVDDGGGWLIFALPPAELAIHPLSENAPAPVMDTGHELLGAVSGVGSVAQTVTAKRQATITKSGFMWKPHRSWGMRALHSEFADWNSGL